MRLTRHFGLVAIAAVTLGAAGWALGEYSEAAGGPEREVREIDQAEAAAVLARDTEALAELWAEDFTVNAPNNAVTQGGRNQVLSLVENGFIDYVVFNREVEAVVIHGDTAIVMGHETVNPRGRAPFAGQTVQRRFTNVWLKREGRWQLTARQATIIGRE